MIFEMLGDLIVDVVFYGFVRLMRKPIGKIFGKRSEDKNENPDDEWGGADLPNPPDQNYLPLLQDRRDWQ